MKNKEQKIVRLLEEGFSYETIKKMSNLHINKIYESLDEAQEYSSTTQVFNLDNETDRKEFDTEVNSRDNNRQISATPQGEVAVTKKSGEVSEDDVDNIHPFDGQQTQDPEQVGPSTNDGDDNYQDGMANEEFYGSIDEDAVIEELFGNSKKKMKTPITTLGIFEQQELSEKCWKGYEKKGMKTMFGKKYPNCVKKKKKTQKEEKVRQVEENILSLINKSQGNMFTKKDILEQGPSIAPVKPTVKPGVRPERGTPYKPKHSPKPKAGTEVKPARPTVKPEVKPERGTPYKPKHSPKPKASDEGLPEFLKFNNLNIKFRDE